jgi:hypothetical protein
MYGSLRFVFKRLIRTHIQTAVSIQNSNLYTRQYATIRILRQFLLSRIWGFSICSPSQWDFRHKSYRSVSLLKSEKEGRGASCDTQHLQCVFAKVKKRFCEKRLISFVMCECLSVRSHWTYLHEIWCLSILRKSVNKIQVWLKYDEDKG